MKIKFRIVLYLFVAFSMASCNQSVQKKTFTIGVSQCSDDLWRQTMNNEMLLETSIYKNTEVIIKTVKDDSKRQTEDIEGLIAQGIDLLVVSPNESKALTPIIQKAFTMGIPVILVDRKIETEDYTCYVGADNYQIGKEAGIYTASILKDKGNVVIIRGWDGSTSDDERYRGFMEIIGRHPDLKVIAEQRGDFLPNVAEDEMSKILDTQPQIDLVFAFNDPMATGVYNALSKYSGQRPYIIGIDALAGAGGGQENISKGRQDASFIYPTGGDKVIDLAVKILSGDSVKRENILSTTVIDKTNIRVLQLQTEQLKEHQQKLEKVNILLDKSLEQYTNQQLLFYAAILALSIISMVLILAIFAYRAKTKANALLEEQKKQLISLSEQLEEATNAKLVFFTNISHEFRTPLTLILGPIESLLAAANLSTEQTQLLYLVKRNSNILLNLVSQIIEFRTYENGKIQLYLQEADFREFIQHLSFPFFDYAKRKHLTFNLQAEYDLPIFSFDKEKIERIYFNLLSNAFKYSQQEGTVEVCLTKETIDGAEYAKLVVSNNSSVIPEDKLKKVFERFYKVNSTDSGTGIGLALVSALVDAHGGKIDVESKPNVGTSFTVYLPLQMVATNVEVGIADNYEQQLSLQNLESDDENTELLIENRNKERPLILVVEDNADMRKYMRVVLEADFDVLEAVDGKQGIEKAIKFVPDIVISDVMMPQKDGFEVCKTIKGTITTSHIPVILLTACSLDEQKAIGFESGSDAYIAKPFNAEILKIRIKTLIDNRQKMIESFGSTIIADELTTSQGEQEQLFINEFKQYVEKNISNPVLTVDELAMNLNLSKSQLYRKVKSLTNYSPNELIRIIRLQYAKQLLVHADVNVSEVAYKSGFSSLSYFSKCFKEQYKKSPTEYLFGMK